MARAHYIAPTSAGGQAAKLGECVKCLVHTYYQSWEKRGDAWGLDQDEPVSSSFFPSVKASEGKDPRAPPMSIGTPCLLKDLEL